MFDPKAHKPDPSKVSKEEGAYLDKPGVYLLVFIWGKSINQTPNGNAYMAMKVRVIAGPLAGSYFWHDVFLSPGALGRLGALCAAMGQEEAFDPDDDVEVRNALLRRPFKGRVEVRKSGEKKYAKIAFAEPKVTDDEARLMDEWTANDEEEQRAKRAAGGGGGGGERGSQQGFPSDDAPPHDDKDKIPF